MMNKLVKWSTIAAASLPLLSLAQYRYSPAPLQPGAGAQAAPISRIEDFVRVLDTFIGWFQAIIFILAVIFILWAAFLYITSAGSPDKVKQAQTILIYAAVGIAVALLAYAVKPIVEQLLG